MGRIKTELEDLSLRFWSPTPTRRSSHALDGKRKGSDAFIAEIRRKLETRSVGRGRPGEDLRPHQERVVDLPEDPAPEDRRRPGLRLRRVPHPDGLGQGLLRRARHRALDLAAGAGAHQGLHRHSEAEHVPVAPHLRDDRRRAALRSADPDARDAPDRRGEASPRTGSTRSSRGPQGGETERVAWLRHILEWQQETKDPREFLEMVKVDLYPDEVYAFTPKGRSSPFRAGRRRWTSPTGFTPRSDTG